MYICPNCKATSEQPTNFCASCGAAMMVQEAPVAEQPVVSPDAPLDFSKEEESFNFTSNSSSSTIDFDFIVDASVNFDDFCEYFDIEAEADSVSVGGWVMEQLGRIAENGDEFSFGKLDVTVLETDSSRNLSAIL